MESNRITELQKPLVDALQRMHRPVEALSLIALAKEFYTDEQRTQLYAQYAGLIEAEKQAGELVRCSGPNDTLGWEERVKQYGEQAARQQMAPRIDAMSKREKALKDMLDFEASHGLIVRLYDQKVHFSKRGS